MDSATRMRTPVTVTAADIRDACWIIGQFVRITARRPEVIAQMTEDHPDFAVGMCHLAHRFASDKEQPTIDEGMSVVSMDDLMLPLVAWSNAMQQRAMDAAGSREPTPEEVAERVAHCAQVRLIDNDRLGEYGL